jgi:hypothetical protein
VSPCLGLEDEAGNWNAMVYPNPGSGIFTLTLSQIPTTNTEIRLVDALGQVLYAGMLTEQSKQFDFSHLASATYYLLINNNDADIHLFSLNYFSESDLNDVLKNIKGKKMMFYYQNQNYHHTNKQKEIELQNQLSKYTEIIGKHTGYGWWTYIRHFIIKN